MNFIRSTSLFCLSVLGMQLTGCSALDKMSNHASVSPNPLSIAATVIQPAAAPAKTGTTPANQETLLVYPGLTAQGKSSPPLGDKKIAVLMISFNGGAFNYSPQSMNQAFFGADDSVADVYRKMSFGQLRLSGDVIPLDISPDFDNEVGCMCSNGTQKEAGLYVLQERANAKAAEKGYNLERDYEHVVYQFMNHPKCSQGVGVLGGRATFFFGNDLGFIGGYLHELAHNMNIGHDNHGFPAWDDQVGQNVYNGMGGFMAVTQDGYGVQGMTPPEKFMAGWLSASEVVQVTTAGDYWIRSSDLDGGDTNIPRLLKIPLSVGPSNLITITYRSDSNKYAHNLAEWSAVYHFHPLNSVNVHWMNTEGYQRAGCRATDRDTFAAAYLVDNQVFVDDLNGVVITQLEHNDTLAKVRVSFVDKKQTRDQSYLEAHIVAVDGTPFNGDPEVVPGGSRAKTYTVPKGQEAVTLTVRVNGSSPIGAADAFMQPFAQPMYYDHSILPNGSSRDLTFTFKTADLVDDGESNMVSPWITIETPQGHQSLVGPISFGVDRR